jgi:hypothetical protein
MVRFSSLAFFLARPIVALILGLDRALIALSCLLDGFLLTVLDAAKETTTMSPMITDSELLLDQSAPPARWSRPVLESRRMPHPLPALLATAPAARDSVSAEHLEGADAARLPLPASWLS